MARKCHRQECGTHLIFVGEQFLGEGCPGALDSKEFRALVISGPALIPEPAFEPAEPGSGNLIAWADPIRSETDESPTENSVCGDREVNGDLG